MAIAFDTAVNGSFVNPGTTLTWSHTCAANAVLVVTVITFSAAIVPTGVTYNGTAMTKVENYTDTGGTMGMSDWILLTPASGAHNVVVSSASTGIVGLSQSYTGADTTTNPVAFNHSTGSIGNGIKPSVVVTNVTGGAIVGFAYKGNSITNGVTGGTERVHEAAITNGGAGDILGAASGSQTYAATLSLDGAGTNFFSAQVMVLQPPAAAGISLPFKSLLGVGI